MVKFFLSVFLVMLSTSCLRGVPASNDIEAAACGFLAMQIFSGKMGEYDRYHGDPVEIVFIETDGIKGQLIKMSKDSGFSVTTKVGQVKRIDGMPAVKCVVHEYKKSGWGDVLGSHVVRLKEKRPGYRIWDIIEGNFVARDSD